MGPFLNVSNHPVADWSQAQRAGALALGSALVDVPFPHVDPAADDREIANLGAELVTSVLAHAPAAVSEIKASSTFMAGPASATRTRPRRSWR